MNGFYEYLPLLITAIIIIFLTYFVKIIVERILKSNLKRLNIRDSLIDVFLKLLGVGIWIVGLLIAAATLFPSVSVSNILTAIGLGSVAVGLAFKDIFENFMAGILILLREPFKINDYIECENYKGRVEAITIRDTFVRQSDGQRVVMPNSMLFKNPVTVITDLEKRRTTIFCGLTYDRNINEVISIIKAAVENTESVLKSDAVEVYAHKFSDSTIDYEITWWTMPKPADIRKSRSFVINAIYKALNDNQIEIPYPHREIIFKNELQSVELEKKN